MRRIVGALVLALVVAGCGGGDDDSASSTSSTAAAGDGSTSSTAATDATAAPQDPGTTAAPPTTRDRAADQALAERVVLQASDAPAGWTSEPSSDDDDSEYDRQYAECAGVPVEHVEPDFPEADSPDLTGPDDSQANGGVEVAPSVDAAQPLLAAYRDPDTPRCFTETLQAVMVEAMAQDGAPPGLTIGRPTFEPLPFAAIADDTAAFRVTMTMSGNGVTIPLYADAVLVRSGRVVMDGLFTSLFEPFPTAESERMMRAMAGRVPAGA